MTLGLYSYTKDPRIAAIHRSNSEDWVLEMRNTQPEDAGNNQSILRYLKSQNLLGFPEKDLTIFDVVDVLSFHSILDSLAIYRPFY